MLRKLAPILSLVLMAVLAAAPAATAEDKTEGAFDLVWNACYEGPGEEIPDWIGTIDFDGDVYDMVFFNVGSGRPPNHKVEAPLGSFNEIWAVYDGLELVFDEECAVETFEGDLVLWGLDRGMSNADLAEYQMIGTVEEAVGDFDGLAGKNVSMSGTFYQEDEKTYAPGVLEIG